MRWDPCPTYPNGNFKAVINGGPVTLASGHGISIVNVAVAAGDSVIVTPGYLYITGASIANHGTISIGPGNGMDLQGGTTLTLSGSGSFNLTNPSARFWALNGVSTFTNQQTIEGEGGFSLGMNLINQGTITPTPGPCRCNQLPQRIQAPWKPAVAAFCNLPTAPRLHTTTREASSGC